MQGISTALSYAHWPVHRVGCLHLLLPSKTRIRSKEDTALRVAPSILFLLIRDVDLFDTLVVSLGLMTARRRSHWDPWLHLLEPLQLVPLPLRKSHRNPLVRTGGKRLHCCKRHTRRTVYSLDASVSLLLFRIGDYVGEKVYRDVLVVRRSEKTHLAVVLTAVYVHPIT